MFVSLTDPASVPYGTTFLNITYSDIKVHVSSGSSSGWINVNGSGSLNLLSLINITTVLGALHLSNGSIIDKVGFNVTSASIDMNNTIYPVVLPSNKIIANASTSFSVNGTVNIVTDLSPTIVTILTANLTVFIMVPSVRAVIVGNTKLYIIGEREALSARDKEHLDSIKPNITISGISLSSSGNISHISFTVNDNSNNSAFLQHVLVFGNFSTNINMSAVSAVSNLINATGMRKNITVTEHDETAVTESEAIALEHFGTINFIVSKNGSLFLPFTELTSASASGTLPCASLPSVPIFNNDTSIGTVSGREDGQNRSERSTNQSDVVNSDVSSHINGWVSSIGYKVNAHSSATFSFDGVISMGFSRIIMSFIPRNDYRLALQGEDGAHVAGNSTAT